MPDSLPVGPQRPVEGFNPTTSFKPPRPSKGEIHYPYSSYDALLPKESLPLPKKDTLQASPLPKNIASGTFASAGVALPAGDVTIGDAKQPLYVMLPPDILSTAPKPPSIEDSARAESDKKTAPTSKPDKTFNLWAILDRLVATPMARTWTSLQRWTGRVIGNILSPVGRFVARWAEKVNDWAVKPIANAIGRGVSWAFSKGKAILDNMLVNTPRAAFQAVKSWFNTLLGR